LIKKYITIKKIHRFDFKNKIKNYYYYYYYYNQIHNICIWMITNSISFASGMMFTDLPWEILIQKTDLKLNMKLHFLCQHICVVSDPLRERERERVDWYEAFCTKKQVHEGGNWSSDQQSSPYLPSTEATVCWQINFSIPNLILRS
jgi:hypothetical protein